MISKGCCAESPMAFERAESRADSTFTSLKGFPRFRSWSTFSSATSGSKARENQSRRGASSLWQATPTALEKAVEAGVAWCHENSPGLPLSLNVSLLPPVTLSPEADLKRYVLDGIEAAGRVGVVYLTSAAHDRFRTFTVKRFDGRAGLIEGGAAVADDWRSLGQARNRRAARRGGMGGLRFREARVSANERDPWQLASQRLARRPPHERVVFRALLERRRVRAGCFRRSAAVWRARGEHPERLAVAS